MRLKNVGMSVPSPLWPLQVPDGRGKSQTGPALRLWVSAERGGWSGVGCGERGNNPWIRRQMSSSFSSFSLSPFHLLFLLFPFLVHRTVGFYLFTQRLSVWAVPSPCSHPMLLGSCGPGCSLLEFHDTALSPWAWSQTLRFVSWPRYTTWLR